MRLSTLLLALPLPLALAAPAKRDWMDLWPTQLQPNGGAPTTATYIFKYPFPTTVTKTWGVAATGESGTVSGTALAAAVTGSGSPNPLDVLGGMNPFDMDAMTGAIAAAFQQQADELLAQVKKQTITIVCAIVFGTLGGLALIGGLLWCFCRRRKRRAAVKAAPVQRAPVNLDDASEVSSMNEKTGRSSHMAV